MMTWQSLQEATMPEIVSWAAEQSWAKAMATCQQDQGWHAEGDVWTHTQMVLAQFEQLADWSEFDRTERLQLILTALFHDAGKPATSVLDAETGRIRSPKHALVGVEIARQVLREIGCDLTTREHVTQLVRFHGRPPYLLEKTEPEHELISLSWHVNHRLLYNFAIADTRGRTTADMTRAEVDLGLWKLLAEESGCYDQPYPFVNDHARFLYYRDALSSLHYIPHEDYRCHVTMLAGLPGVGKDTWLKNERPELPVVSLDDLREEMDITPTDNQGRVIQAAREQCREYLRKGVSFAFNATNTMRATRKRWIDLFADYQAHVELVYLEPPYKTVLEQNASREQPVPRQVLDHLLRKLEPPTITEAHALQMLDSAKCD